MTQAEQENVMATGFGFVCHPDPTRGNVHWGWSKFSTPDESIWIWNEQNADYPECHWADAMVIDGELRYHCAYTDLRSAIMHHDGRPYGDDKEESLLLQRQAAVLLKDGATTQGLPQLMTDESKMPFGKYQGDNMKDVPPNYLNWLWHKGMKDKDSPIASYIRRNIKNMSQDRPDLIW